MLVDLLANYGWPSQAHVYAIRSAKKSYDNGDQVVAMFWAISMVSKSGISAILSYNCCTIQK